MIDILKVQFITLSILKRELITLVVVRVDVIGVYQMLWHSKLTLATLPVILT